MKAILVERTGGLDALRPVEQPWPRPGPGEIVVRLSHIGVNFADILCRRGTHPGMRQPPIVPGCEGAGIVDACGSSVTRWRVGDRVGVYSPFGGAYAEAIALPQDYAVGLPESMDMASAAAATHTALTAWMAIHGATDVEEAPARGGTMLVTAAAGGLGGMLLQLGAAAGLTVAAAVGSATKAELLLRRGWRHVYDYGAGPLDRAIASDFGTRGMDLVVETVGGAVHRQAQATLAPLGRYVIAGCASGEPAVLDERALLARCARCTWLNLSQVFAQRPDLVRHAWRHLVADHAQGAWQARVSRQFSLDDVAEAHRLMENRLGTDSFVLCT